MFHVFLMDVCGEGGNMKMFHVFLMDVCREDGNMKMKEVRCFFFLFFLVEKKMIL